MHLVFLVVNDLKENTTFTRCPLVHFACFLSSADSKSSFSRKKSFENTIRVSKSLNPDQARCFVGPELSQNCLLKYSATALVGKKLKKTRQ